ELHRSVYGAGPGLRGPNAAPGLRGPSAADGKKVFDDGYLKRLTPLALAIWYQDDGSPSGAVPDEATICVEAMEPETRVRVTDYLRDTWGITSTLVSRAGKAVFVFPRDETAKLHALIAPFVHPTMEYKLLPRYRGRFAVEPV